MTGYDISVALHELAIELDVLEDMADRVLHENDYLSEREELQLRLLNASVAVDEIRNHLK